MTPPPSPPPTAPPAARRRPDSLTLLIAAAAILGAALVIARQTAYGAALSWDSLVYISEARNLLAGQGFAIYEAIPEGRINITEWPPLYPLILAAASLGIFDPLDAAGPLNAIIFGLTVFLAGQYLRGRLKSPFLALWAALAIALAIPLAGLAAWAMAGPAFILLTILALIQTDKFLAAGRTSSLIWAALFCALAWQTRYIGVAAPIAVALLLLSQRGATIPQRARRAAVLALIAAAPTALWLLNIYVFLDANPGNPLPVDYSLPALLWEIIKNLWEWTQLQSPEQWQTIDYLAMAAAALALLLFITAVLLPSAWLFIKNLPEKRNPSGWQPCYLFGGFTLVYLALLLAAMMLGYTYDGLQPRFLTPLYIPLLITAVYTLDQLVTRPNETIPAENANAPPSIKTFITTRIQKAIPAPIPLAAALIAALSLWVAAQAVVNARAITLADAPGRYPNFAAPPWRDSETLQYIRDNALYGYIYSNEPLLVYFHNDVAASYDLAPRSRPAGAAVAASVSGSADSQAQLTQWLAAAPSGSSVIWFKDWRDTLYDYTPAQMRATPGLELITELDDGLIFRLFNTAAFDVYRDGDSLIYLKRPCAPADAAAKFYLHLFPADASDLPPDRQQYGFDNRDFTLAQHGAVTGGQCQAVAPLPDYDIARIRTGQYISGENVIVWTSELTGGDFASLKTDITHTPDPFRAAYNAITAGEYGKPAARALYDIYISPDSLHYLKEDCAPQDTQARFFLHLIPANPDDLPPDRQAPGFDNLDFDFPDYGEARNERCLATIPLPPYQIARIRTGQHTPTQGQIWMSDFRAP